MYIWNYKQYITHLGRPSKKEIRQNFGHHPKSGGGLKGAHKHLIEAKFRHASGAGEGPHLN